MAPKPSATSPAFGVLMVLLAMHVSISHSFIRPENFGTSRPYHHKAADGTVATDSSSTTFEPIFDFSQNDTVESFERIDDAIMGGISTSALRNVPGESYASWSGVCRIDGG